MKKKTKYIIILSAVIVLLAGGNAVYALTHDGEEKIPDERKIEQTEEQTTEQTETDKLDSHEQDNYAKEENQKDVTEHGQQPVTTQQEMTQQTPQPANTSPATNSGGNSGNTVTEAPQPTSTPPTSNNCGNGANTSPQTPTAPSGNNTTIVPEPTTAEVPIPTTTEHTPVWVVDQAAWDEEIPIYEDRLRMVCRTCGGYMYTNEDVVNHPCFMSWYDEWYQVQIGTEIVHHDEVGHWE